MNKTYNQLIDLLKKHSRLTSGSGELLKNLTQELARKNDPELIKLLLDKEDIKKIFFTDIDDVKVFNHEKFIRFVSNKQFLADSYTSFKNKVGLTVEGNYLSESNEVVLTWPYKDCVLEGGMTKEDQKKDEIFFNEILAPDEINRLLDPKVFKSFKRIDKHGEHVFEQFNRDSNGLLKDNLIIKGNNLLVLTSLVKSFAAKAKLIYIDPPYNTGGPTETFTYNNSFNHSTWLTFMKNRLNIAKELIREDGFIAITIDHVELFYLGVLADEIFGSNNRVGIVTIVHKPEGRNQEKFFGTSNEFMLVYAKNIEIAEFEKVILDKELQQRFNLEDEKGHYRLKNFIRLTDGKYSLRINKPHFYYPIYVSKDLSEFSLEKIPNFYEVYPVTKQGVERTWKTSRETFIKRANEGEIVAVNEEHGVTIYEKLREDQIVKTHWIKKEYHAYHFGTKLLEQVLGRKAFSFPKSLYAVIDTLKIMTKDDDLIIDFFAGSGTTAHAVIELNNEDHGNRQFILVEQLSEHVDISLERVVNVLQKDTENSSFIYCELASLNEEWIAKLVNANSRNELLGLWREINNKAFLNYKVDSKKINENAEDFENLSISDMKKFLFECLDKNHLYINYSEIEDKDYGLTEEEIRLNRDFYN